MFASCKYDTIIGMVPTALVPVIKCKGWYGFIFLGGVRDGMGLPSFVKSSSEIYDCSLLAMDLLTMVVCVIVFTCQQRRLVQVQAMVLVFQSRRVPQAVGMAFPRLL